MPALSRAEIDEALRDDPAYDEFQPEAEEPGDYERYEILREPTAGEQTFLAQGFQRDVAEDLAQRFGTYEKYLREVQEGRAYVASKVLAYWYVVDYWSSIDRDNGVPPREPNRIVVQPTVDVDLLDIVRRMEAIPTAQPAARPPSGPRQAYAICPACGDRAVYPVRKRVRCARPFPHNSPTNGYCLGPR